MANPVLLNNIDHKDLRVITRFGREFGDEIGMVTAFPTEFGELQREYPIFFRKEPGSGRWQAVALLGFELKENLYLRDGRWDAAYLPGAVARGPFLIGFQEQRVDGELRRAARAERADVRVTRDHVPHDLQARRGSRDEPDPGHALGEP